MEILRPRIKKVFFRGNCFLERRLPREGQISVKVGDEVAPFDILGTTFFSLDRKKLRLANSFWQILVSDGQSLASGEVMARKRRPFFLKAAEVRMPFSGTVSLSIEGKDNLLEAISTPERYNLVSGIRAKVARIVEKNSVLLETEAYVVKGVHSSGREVIGEIKVLGSPDRPLLLSDLTPSLTSKIVVAGSFVSSEVINKAQALGVAGLVVGGASAQALRSNPLPILITEGFGRIPMNQDLWTYLKESELKTALLSSARRQMIVPVDGGDAHHLGPETEGLAVLKKGDSVQVFLWPNFGGRGEVLEVGSVPKRLSSGLEDFTAIVRFINVINGETAEVPVSNLGILS